MKKFLTRYSVLIVCLLVSGAVLFKTSQAVQTAEKEKRRIQNKIEAEQGRLRLLQAEWAHLNNPARLERLAQDVLGIEPRHRSPVFVEPSQLDLEPQDPLQPVVFHAGGRHE